MTLSLRYRIVLPLVPLLVLVAVLGIFGAVLLSRLGSSIGAILHDNYRSVRYMEALGESLERIDSSFTFAMTGKEERARQQYESHWAQYQDWLTKERNNITEPGEDQLVQELDRLTRRYRQQGEVFFGRPMHAPERKQDYYGDGGLEATFKQLKAVTRNIADLNHRSMMHASAEAQQAAAASFFWFGVGLVVALLLAALSALHTVRSVLRPIRALTDAALNISAGNLDQVLPQDQGDELGQLAGAFNTMARHLREYRQSQSARLLRAQKTSQATIDSFPDPVVVLDPEGRVEMANPAARRLLGVLPRHDGQPGGVWNPPEPLREPLARALRDQGNYLPEGLDHAILLNGGGRERAVLPRVLFIRDPHGHALGTAVLLQDVTRLRLLDQVKSNLVATASHELKTPLTSLRLALHLLLEEETLGPLSPKQTELLLDARDNSERLLAVVEHLLDLARFEQGWRQLDTRPEAPAELLQAAAEAVRPRAVDKGVELTLDVPPDLPDVSADAGRIGHALRNLLDNALTYTDRGGKITLSARAADGAVELAVADTGIGIAPEHLPHVFEKFFRVPGQSRGAGTGLGLAIVQEIATAHGGTVTCESQPGTGMVFRLTLPVAENIV